MTLVLLVIVANRVAERTYLAQLIRELIFRKAVRRGQRRESTFTQNRKLLAEHQRCREM